VNPALRSTGNSLRLKDRPAARGLAYVRQVVAQYWPYLKVVLGLIVVAVVGVQFTHDLLDPSLWQRSLRPAWIVASGLLFLAGFSFSAFTWRWLLYCCDRTPRLYPTIRAYFLGQLGRYLPGKAWAMFFRAEMLRSEGVPMRVGAVTAFYEVFITMSGAALASALLFALFAPETGYRPHGHILHDLIRLRVPSEVDPGKQTCVLMAFGFLAIVGAPALPRVFNAIARRLAAPFDADTGLPHFTWQHLGGGLVFSCTGWLFLGASLACALYAVEGPDLPWSLNLVGRVLAIMGVSYVAGFIVVVTPSGLGVRELFLVMFLTGLLRETATEMENSRGLAVLTALVLRVAWSGAELLLVTLLWMIKVAPPDAGQHAA